MNNLSFLTPKWPAPAHIKAFTTFRSDGHSNAPYHSLNLAAHVNDNLDDVLKNRQKLTLDTHLPSEPKWINQTHSNIAVQAETISDTQDIAAQRITADASYTQKSQTVCVVLTADCLPILVTNKEGSEIAAIHAGWRGLANGIIENTFAKLHSSPENLLVWIGPSVLQPNYEVGEDFYAEFTKTHTATECEKAFQKTDTPKKWQANVPLLACQRLKKLGVLNQNVYLSNECTYANSERYFSYRREGITGRMASLIFIDQ